MSREWKPGDVAMVETPSHGWRPSVMIGHDPGERCWHSAYNSGDLRCLAADAAAVRPLVVIDPEDREQVERFREIASRWADQVPYSDMREPGDMDHTDAMQAALREVADPKPPKPAEPTGLGAVVEDAGGTLWVRTPKDGNSVQTEWVSSHSTCHTWAALDAVRVLSGGVQA